MAARKVRIYQEDWLPFQNLPAAVAAFERATGIGVELAWDKVGVGTIEHMFDQMARSFGDDDPPFDLVCMDEVMLRAYARRGRVQELDVWMVRDGITLDDHTAATVGAATYGGACIGLPCVNVSSMLLYRRDLLDRYDLLDRTTEVPGVGHEVPGIDLVKKGTPRCMAGDDSLFASRAFDDSPWPEPGTVEDSAMPPGRIHWMRLHVEVAAELKEQPLFLDVSCNGHVSVYVNGEEVLRAGSPSAEPCASDTPDGEHPRLVVPIAFSGDGLETIAVRMDLAEGHNGPRPELRMTLHDRRIDGIVQQGNLHAGTFIGINLIIFLLAIILWSFDRRDRNWLLLACITLITACRSFTFASGNWDIGLDRSTHSVMEIASEALRFWPSYLLLLLSGSVVWSALGLAVTGRRVPISLVTSSW